MKQIVIIELFFAHFVLIYSNFSPVLTADLNVTNDKYIGRDYTSPHSSCVLSAFNATITVKPVNKVFSGTTFAYVSPETSIGKTTICGEYLIQHYYRFDETFNKTSERQSLFSMGFEIGVGNSVDMHFKYVEVLCNDPNGCIRHNKKYCSKDNSKEELVAKHCLRMSVSFPLTLLKAGQTYQCSHNSRTSIKDIPYLHDLPEYQGYFEVDLHYLRIDVSNSTETFNPIRYCLMDWILDTTVIITVSSILCLILLSIVFKCLIDCRRDAKRKKNRKKDSESLSWNKCQNSSETEMLGTIDEK